jgi:phosphatidylinositol-3,4,5-trisphosphate 3-phosphatase/dual-specificity protein phosphatase PTEN
MAGFFLTRYLRALVSKNHRRLITAGHDLDLSYITERIIAMSYPAENYDTLFRNPMSQVRKFLDTRHGKHYKVGNQRR